MHALTHTHSLTFNLVESNWLAQLLWTDKLMHQQRYRADL